MNHVPTWVVKRKGWEEKSIQEIEELTGEKEEYIITE